jgi:hypothetical protein
MKITIELSENEVKGIKAYLKDFDGIAPSKNDIKVYVQGIVSGTINAPQEAVSGYINQFENR